LCPGCVVANVYAFPGVPDEMRALFEQVANEFEGDAVSRTLYTSQPEGSMVEELGDLRERFDVSVGSYPDTEGHNRLRILGTDSGTVEEATAWLRERIAVVDGPEQ
jgi:molybdopterin-biosynthesis enzyme MoeA-like protein